MNNLFIINVKKHFRKRRRNCNSSKQMKRLLEWNLILEGGVAPENEGFAEDFAAEAIPAKYIPARRT